MNANPGKFTLLAWTLAFLLGTPVILLALAFIDGLLRYSQ